MYCTINKHMVRDICVSLWYVVGFDHGIPCCVKNMARGTQLRQFVYWVPRAMFFTRHGRPWSNPIIARLLIDFFAVFYLNKYEF